MRNTIKAKTPAGYHVRHVDPINNDGNDRIIGEKAIKRLVEDEELFDDFDGSLDDLIHNLSLLDIERDDIYIIMRFFTSYPIDKEYIKRKLKDYIRMVK